jgi:hypothetical protein
MICKVCDRPSKKEICSGCERFIASAKENMPVALKNAIALAGNIPASQLCREYSIQNCHDCDDKQCGDNLRL